MNQFTSNMKSSSLQIKVSAPGKVILHGEHSVVYGKLAIAASLGLRTTLTLTECDDDEKLLGVSLPALDGFTKTIKLQQLNSFLSSDDLKEAVPIWSEPEHLNYELLISKIETFLLKNDLTNLQDAQLASLKSLLLLLVIILAPAKVLLEKSANLLLVTDLSIGAGTGSSASFNVSVAALFCEYLKHKASAEVKTALNLDSLVLGKFSDFELNLISKWAFCAERIIHGTPSGVDNTICTFGGIVKFRKGTQPKLLALNDALKFKILLINTKVPRETKKLVAVAAELKARHPILVEHILNSLEYVSETAIRKIEDIAESNVEESYNELGKLFSINHQLLSCLGVSHCKLDEIVLILNSFGLSGKLTGAGGGGYAICLIPPFLQRKIIGDVVLRLEAEGFHVDEVELGGVGVKVH